MFIHVFILPMNRRKEPTLKRCLYIEYHTINRNLRLALIVPIDFDWIIKFIHWTSIHCNDGTIKYFDCYVDQIFHSKTKSFAWSIENSMEQPFERDFHRVDIQCVCVTILLAFQNIFSVHRHIQIKWNNIFFESPKEKGHLWGRESHSNFILILTLTLTFTLFFIHIEHHTEWWHQYKSTTTTYKMCLKPYFIPL